MKYLGYIFFFEYPDSIWDQVVLFIAHVIEKQKKIYF